MPFTITKDFVFHASHILHGLPENHKCSNLHGHEYKVTLYLIGNHLDERGFLLDFGELGEFKRWLDGTFDHAHIATNEHESKAIKNAVLNLKNSVAHNYDYPFESRMFEQRTVIINAPTTAENIAKYIYDQWSEIIPYLRVVEVWETSKAKATYIPPEHANPFREDS